MGFAKNLAHLRRAHGYMSQTQLAKALAAQYGDKAPTAQSISAWETLKWKPSRDNVELLGDFFNVSTDWLLRNHDTYADNGVLPPPSQKSWINQIEPPVQKQQDSYSLDELEAIIHSLLQKQKLTEDEEMLLDAWRCEDYATILELIAIKLKK